MACSNELPKKFKTWLEFYDYIVRNIDTKILDLEPSEYERQKTILFEEEFICEINSSSYPSGKVKEYTEYNWGFIKTKALEQLQEARFDFRKIMVFKEVFERTFHIYRDKIAFEMWEEIEEKLLIQSKK